MLISLSKRGREAPDVTATWSRVLRTEDTTLLEERYDPVDEVVQAARREMGMRMKPSAASCWTKVSSASATVRGVPMKDCLAVVSMTVPRIDSPLASDRARHPRRPRAGPRPAPGPGLRTARGRGRCRERSFRVVRGEVAAPDPFQGEEGVLRGDLLPADLGGPLLGLGVRVTEDVGGARHDLEVRRAACRSAPAGPLVSA